MDALSSVLFLWSAVVGGSALGLVAALTLPRRNG